MLRHWPALDIPEADDVLLAALDDFSPTAVEEREPGPRVFFATCEHRDSALATLGRQQIAAIAVDVSDEDWAVRSQQNLEPITVGRITILPVPHAPVRHPDASPIAIVIEPSMGFGTGHHATTRLCLRALQNVELSDAFVLDVGTGSGVLAIAAVRLGAARGHGIDVDADAVQSANENLGINRDARNVTFAVTDLAAAPLPRADVLVANLTGAVLVRSAASLLAATNPGGTLVLSGMLASEEDEVCAAFAGATLHGRAQEDEWVCLTMKKR